MSLPGVVIDPGLGYPDSSDAYGPNARIPELPDVQVVRTPNPVYDAVRRSLQLVGLDAARIDTPDWNPFGDLIGPGGRVFLLANFVYHRRPNESRAAFASKCTHASVLRPLIDYALKAVGPDGSVSFGNAPLQSCDWNAVQRDVGADVLRAHYDGLGARVTPRDLRLFIARKNALGHTMAIVERDQEANAVEVQLGSDSLLDALYAEGESPRFRVADYDPRRLEAFHSRGSHRYVMHRAVLESDLVISVPKLKTHEKVGITCVLKGFVGAVGHKDCLAHHRFGAPARGGDEYPSGSSARHSLSAFHDLVQTHRANSDIRARGGATVALLQVADKVARRVLGRAGAIQGGAWHGNDTAWRMALDLTRILRFADAQGRMHPDLQRRHFAVVDGIVGGEGEGPLNPKPVTTGALIAGHNAEDVDWVAAHLMGFGPSKIPLLREAYTPRGQPLSSAPPQAVRIDGREVLLEQLHPAGDRAYEPPPGWREYLAGAAASRQ